MSKTKTRSLIILLAIIPLLPWLFLKPLYERIRTIDVAVSSFSQISALVGTVLFALFLISTTNTTFVRNIFGKKSDEDTISSQLSVVSFSLLMTHPILLLVGLASASFGELFQDKAGWALSFGIYASILLVALYVCSFFAKQKNIILKSAPIAMTSVLFLGTLHAFFIPSSLSESSFIKYYILGFVSLAILLQAHRLFVSLLPQSKTTKTAEEYSI